MKRSAILNQSLVNQPDGDLKDADSNALSRCRMAKELIELSDYGGARESLAGLWNCVGQHPDLSGLSLTVQAEVLLRVGALTGWIGATSQINGAQEFAKNLLTQCISIYEEIEDTEKRAEAIVDLGLCYYRENHYDDARVSFQSVLDLITDGEQRARALMNLAIIEWQLLRFHSAVNLLEEALTIAAGNNKHLEGKIQLQLSMVLTNLWSEEQKEEYIDRALMAATDASINFENEGNIRYEAIVENNLGFLYLSLGQFLEANINLDRAKRLFERLHDTANMARVDETRMRVLLSQQRIKEARRLGESVVRSLEKGEERAVLAEALTTLGKVMVRMCEYREARQTFERSIAEAASVNDQVGAGLACLTMLEELCDRFMPGELIALYRRADAFLERSTGREISSRLRHCARLVMQTLPHIEAAFASPHGESNSTLQDRKKLFLERFEALEIKRALEKSDGGVTAASRLLGISHQTLDYKLKKLDQELSSSRKPQRVRHRSIIKK